MKLKCSNCGPVKQVKFDGYAFGDRMLEGVYFIGTWNEKNNSWSVKIHPDDDDGYWEELNQELWLKRAEEFLAESIEQNDFGFGCTLCTGGGVELVVESDDGQSL